MDPLTHGLLGALTAQAVADTPFITALGKQATRRTRLPIGVTLAATLAALFPDIDYLLFWLDPLRFLADWHRGITHSLLALPLWSLLLGLLLSTLAGRRWQWRCYTVFCALGLLSHIMLDLLTAYGTQLFAPFSDDRFGFSLIYVVDPYFTAIMLLPVLLLVLHHYKKKAPGHRKSLSPSRVARLGLLMLFPYLGLLVSLKEEAKALGEQMATEQGLLATGVDALPQPLSPFNWKVLVSQADGYRVALVHLRGRPQLPTRLPGPEWLHRLARAYEATERLHWQPFPRPGEAPDSKLIHNAWRQPPLEPFRRFAHFPILAGIDRDGQRECIWFTDLRYTLPTIRPFFRYGVCRDNGSDAWQLHRLRRFTDHQRQLL